MLTVGDLRVYEESLLMLCESVVYNKHKDVWDWSLTNSGEDHSFDLKFFNKKNPLSPQKTYKMTIVIEEVESCHVNEFK